jgi:hypothetical protein
MATCTGRQIADPDRSVELGSVYLVVTLKTGVFLHSDGMAKRTG